MLVLGVDPGLTRCGVGLVEGSLGRPLNLRHVEVIRSPNDQPLARRLSHQIERLRELVEAYHPEVVAIERMFSQHNVRTVMGTAQSSAMAVLSAGEAGLPVSWHTPTEVKAAVTGTGRADKSAVAEMVVRILRLDRAPRPVDATDALALAICHVWRGCADRRIAEAVARAPRARIPAPARTPVNPRARTDPAVEPRTVDRAATLAVVRTGARPGVRRAP